MCFKSRVIGPYLNYLAVCSLTLNDSGDSERVHLRGSCFPGIRLTAIATNAKKSPFASQTDLHASLLHKLAFPAPTPISYLAHDTHAPAGRRDGPHVVKSLLGLDGRALSDLATEDAEAERALGY